MRPEFQFRVKKKRKNPVTQETEPYVPFFEKCMRFIGSGVSVFFFVSYIFLKFCTTSFIGFSRRCLSYWYYSVQDYIQKHIRQRL